MSEMTIVPDIYIIGAQKSGTTTLYDWLAQHPQIYGHPLAKDHPFFANERVYHEGLETFRSFSQKAPKGSFVLGGEANAMYAPAGAQRMFHTIPCTRLIAILRNPVQRAYSAYSYAVERMMEDRTLDQAIRDELDGIRYMEEDALQRDYLEHGNYAFQLREIHKFFSKDQVYVMILEEVMKNPKHELRELFRFIGVSEDFEPDLTVRNETKGGYRSKWIAKIIYARPSSKFVSKLGKVIFPFSIRTAIRRFLAEVNRVERAKPEFPEHVRQRMKEYYKDEILDLEELLGREIEVWK